MATIAAQKSITVEQFLLQYGENNRYELIDGEVFDLEPTGPHAREAALLDHQVAALIDRKSDGL